MAAALYSFAPQFGALVAQAAKPSPRGSQLAVLAAYAPGASHQTNIAQLPVLAAYAPPQAHLSKAAQAQLLVAYADVEANVRSRSSQGALLIAYGTGVPHSTRSDSWTFVMDGHRFWVVPLGPEGDWAYDVTTKQWCKLYTQGFSGLNFTHGVMWGLRVVGSDLLYPTLYEMAVAYPDDEGWRPVMHVVTGGLATRSTNMVGVANFRFTATPGVLNDASTAVNLSFSDDNGKTWITAESIAVAQGKHDTELIWNALGSFNSPGRIFQVSDQGGMLSIYGADAALNNYDEDDAGGGGGNGG